MSHTDVGPLPAYNSLTDNHLSGYFSNTRMRRHLRKSGLITKKGEIVTENTYRLNMARKEHKKHVKNMLAQAIVHKTLDLERSRQSEIRKKLEEIAKIELVRHVKSDRNRRLEDAILPYLAPKSAKERTKHPKKSAPSRTQSSPARGRQRSEIKESNGTISAVPERASRETKRENCILPLVSPKGGGGSRPSSSSTYSDMRSKGRYRPARPKSTPSRKGKRPISALSSNFDDENETVVYLDDEGRPISPSHIDENELRYASKDPIDSRHLYSLDTAALRKYAVLMAQLEQGKDRLASPYLVPQVPIPPKSPHHGGTPRSAHRQRVSAERLDSPKRPAVSDQAYLHPSCSPKSFRGQQQSMCEIFMIYHGQALSLAREQLDKRQDVAIEQQHCGGNTLTVFKDKMEPNTEFSFISYRHCGYPFALTVYIDGKMDCRISTCCEYRHSKGRRIAGKKGHFSVKTITGAKPCYKCQVEKGIRIKSQAPRPKLKRPPQHQEEVVVVETKEEQPEEKQDDEPVTRHRDEEEILVPVEDDDRKGGEADGDDYDDDDFEESEPEEAYVYSAIHSTERGNEDSDESGAQSGRVQNIIKIANQRVEEAAIKECKDDGGNDERGARTKKDPRKGTCHEDVDEDNSMSSCKSDEDYYEYKERMLKKLEEQEVKKNRKKEKHKAVGETDNVESGSRRKAQDEGGDGKKKSSTSSSKPKTKGNNAGRGSKRRTSKKKGAGGEGEYSTDGNATADDVSEIESEMATSPRKTETGKGDDKGQEIELKPIESLKVENSISKDKLNSIEIKKSLVSPSSSNLSQNEQLDKLAKLPQIQSSPRNGVISENVGDSGDRTNVKTGNDFHVDICPTDSFIRAEEDSDDTPDRNNDKYDNLRGNANHEGVQGAKDKKPHRGKKSQQEPKLIKEQSLRLEHSQEQKKKATRPSDSKIMVHPMRKTGENKYLNKQMKEQIELRVKSEEAAKNALDESKRRGMYLSDLSPRMKVIRGVVGDDGSESEGDDDETYSKVLLRDGRASVSDTEQDSDVRRRDYILSGSDRRSQKQHVTFIENANEWHDENKPQYRVLIDIDNEQEKEKVKEEKGRRKKEREARRQNRLDDARGFVATTPEVQCKDEPEIDDPAGDDIHVEINSQARSKLPQTANKGVSEREIEDGDIKQEHFSRQNHDENKAYQHHFSEEPKISSSKEPQLQALPMVDTHINLNEDASEVDEVMSDGEEMNEDAGNPETWYEMSTPCKDSENIEIVGTKYVESENERYAHHYKAFKESPNVDNEFVKSTQGVVSILSSHDPLPTEQEADLLHISVLSKNKAQESKEHEEENDSSTQLNKISNAVITPETEFNVQSENDTITKEENVFKDELKLNYTNGNQQRYGPEERKQKFKASPRPSMDNLTAMNLRDLFLGTPSKMIDDADQINEEENNVGKGAQETPTDLDKPEIKVNDCAITTDREKSDDSRKLIEMKCNDTSPQNQSETHTDLADDYVTRVNSSMSVNEKKPSTGKKVNKLEEIYDNDSYSDDFIENDEDRKEGLTEKPTSLDEVEQSKEDIKKTDCDKSERNIPGLNALNDENKLSNSIEKVTTIKGKEKLNTDEIAETKTEIDDLKEDDSSSDDVNGIDELIEVLENQLEGSKRSRDGNCSYQAENNVPSNQKSNDIASFDLAVGSSSDLIEKNSNDEANDHHSAKNSFEAHSSLEDNYTCSITEGDSSSDDLEKQAKEYVEGLLTSLSAVGFDDMDPPIKESDSQHKKDQEDEGVTALPSKRKNRELTRQAPVLTENVSNVSLNGENIDSQVDEVNHNKLDLNTSDNLVSPSSPALPTTPKNSSLVDPNSPHAEKRRQQKLTVSFAVNEDETDDKGDKEEFESEKSWEEADDIEREEEYEKLERQIEMSLCKSP